MYLDVSFFPVLNAEIHQDFLSVSGNFLFCRPGIHGQNNAVLIGFDLLLLIVIKNSHMIGLNSLMIQGISFGN